MRSSTVGISCQVRYPPKQRGIKQTLLAHGVHRWSMMSHTNTNRLGVARRPGNVFSRAHQRWPEHSQPNPPPKKKNCLTLPCALCALFRKRGINAKNHEEPLLSLFRCPAVPGGAPAASYSIRVPPACILSLDQRGPRCARCAWRPFWLSWPCEFEFDHFFQIGGGSCKLLDDNDTST